MSKLTNTLYEAIGKVVEDFGIPESSVSLERPTDSSHGDYSTNIALVGFKQFTVSDSSHKEKVKSPLQLAEHIKEKVASNDQLADVIEKVEVVRPGFINFWVKMDYLVGQVEELTKNIETKALSENLKGKKVMIEFADPNPFKAFHIGHLRNISLGETFARLLESQGATVWRVNYQGDVGMHVAKAMYGLLRLCHAELGSASINEILKQVQDDSLHEKVKLLGEAYALGSKAYEEDEKAKAEIRALNVKVYKNDPSIQAIWEEGKKWSLDHFEEIYKRVNTKYDRYYFESEVAGPGRDIVLSHIEDGIFERHDDAVVFRGAHTRVFVSSEDYATYEAKDMALAGIKHKDFAYDQSIIITAHEQAPYFGVVLDAMKKVFPDLAAKTTHLSFGFVRLKDTKMSSRLGNIITGQWLLDEAKTKILEEFKDMDDETAEKVAVGAVKYSMLKFSRESDIQFSFEESINLAGNSGPYVQYTYVRAQSVLHKSEARNPKHETNSNFENSNISNIVSNFDIRISNLKPEEVSLLRLLHRFPEVVDEAAEKFAPNIIGNYLFDLSQLFNLFYQKHQILKGEETAFRVALTGAISQVLKRGLDLLGIDAPDRM